MAWREILFVTTACWLWACEEKKSEPRLSPPPATSSAAPAAEAPAPAPSASVAKVEAPTPVDAPLIGANVPEFGCFARSASNDVLACVLGTKGNDGSEAEWITKLVFVPVLKGATAPASIAITNVKTDMVSFETTKSTLSSSVREKLTKALAGYTRLTPTTSLEKGSFQVGAAEVRVNHRAGGAAPAENADEALGNVGGLESAKLEVKVGKTIRELDAHSESNVGYKVQVFAFGNDFVLERSVSLVGEGRSQVQSHAWVCMDGSCKAVR